MNYVIPVSYRYVLFVSYMGLLVIIKSAFFDISILCTLYRGRGGLVGRVTFCEFICFFLTTCFAN
jgi:hypothetical protein